MADKVESRKHKQATGSFVKKNISLKLMNKKEGIPFSLYRLWIMFLVPFAHKSEVLSTGNFTSPPCVESLYLFGVSLLCTLVFNNDILLPFFASYMLISTTFLILLIYLLISPCFSP
jgi:hypothetical protein